MYTGCGLMRRKVGLVCTILAVCELIPAHVKHLIHLATIALHDVDTATLAHTPYSWKKLT